MRIVGTLNVSHFQSYGRQGYHCFSSCLVETGESFTFYRLFLEVCLFLPFINPEHQAGNLVAPSLI